MFQTYNDLLLSSFFVCLSRRDRRELKNNFQLNNGQTSRSSISKAAPGARLEERDRAWSVPIPPIRYFTESYARRRQYACFRVLWQNPCRWHCTSLSTARVHTTNWLLRRINAAFNELGNPPELFMAITGEDSSIVYYKFSTGIVKPQL